MKSSYWTLCLVALFVCFPGGISENLDNGETYLDRRKNTAVSDIENFLFPGDVVMESEAKDTCDDDDESKKCQNGGTCAEKDSVKLCSCKPGTSGDFCETVAKCSGIDCGKDATCVLDTESEEVMCKCKKTELSFDESDKKCKVDYCKENCGTHESVICEGNKFVNTAFTNCKCKVEKMAFDSTLKECKHTCDDDDESKRCQNGGTCAEKDSVKFCSCKPGTSGDFCETVAKCSGIDCGKDATCVLDTESEEVMCKCKKTELSFDESDKKCKVDYCKENCGTHESVICEGNKFVNTAFTNCKCKVEKMAFNSTLKECKPDLCFDECGVAYDSKGDVQCENGPFGLKGDIKCKCKAASKKFDTVKRTCRDTCADSTETKKCQNGGSCEGTDPFKFCSCHNETSGDFCQTVDKCKEMDCGNEATCVLDDSGKVLCKCKQTELSFVESDKKCIASCDETTESKMCQNGGSCTEKDSVKLCSCKPGTSGDFCETVAKCSGIDCGKDATCVLDTESEEVMCKCKKTELSFDESDKKCKVDYCKENCGTHQSVKCEGNKFVNTRFTNCKCTFEKMAFNSTLKECKPDLCFDKCGVAYDSKGDVRCENGPFGVKGEIKCKCKIPSKKFDTEENTCRDTCTDDSKCKPGECVEQEGGNKFCECPTGTSGDKCKTVDDCVAEGKWSKCKGNKGTCSYNATKNEAECKCKTNKQKPSEKMGFCVDVCDNGKCTGNRNCDNGLCECKPGYAGDECKQLTGCSKEKVEECEKAKATCVYAETEPYATCKCKESGYTYEDSKCTHDFCKTHACNDAECVFDDKSKVGYCKCPPGKYYDYKEEKCTEPDACLLRKEPCRENEVCTDGICECPYSRENDTLPCIKTDCNPDNCFDGAKCSGGNCVCTDGNIYANNECLSGSCIFNKDFKTECECPDKFEKDDKKKCLLKKDSEYKECSKGCGYGLCYKDGEKEECACFADEYVEEKDGKCVLKVENCASKKLSKDLMTCECSGIYKKAKDGITCELVTCEDSSLRDLCQSYNAVCKMRWVDIPDDWKLEDYCECPTGYLKDESRKKCIDACSTEQFMRECMKKNQFCYHSKLDNDQKRVADCRCPPPIKYEDGACAGLSDNAYLIKNIPIMKAKYVKNAAVDSVLLNGDIIDSLKQTYGENMLDYGYLHDFKVDDNVLKCTVWVVFKEDAEDVKERIRLQSQKFEDACPEENNCNNDTMIWPPSILMSEKHLKDVSLENLTFCSFAKDLLCGESTECEDNQKCTCLPGFKAQIMTMRVFGDVVVQGCEDVDECAMKTDECPENTKCENTHGSYRCNCEPGFRKEQESDDKNDKGKCIGLCSTSPCGKGSCSLVNNTVDCKCDLGFAGSFCNRKDVNLASAKKQVVVVGAVLGAILGVALIGFILFYKKVRKSYHSQDFTPAPRRDNAEMMERRGPMRGVVNKSYE